MGFFSKIFGKDTIKMQDVEDVPEKEPFITQRDKEKTCVPKTNGEKSSEASPFLDDCDE